MSKTKTLHMHHTFLYISFPFLHDFNVKMPNFAFNGERKQATTKFYSNTKKAVQNETKLPLRKLLSP